MTLCGRQHFRRTMLILRVPSRQVVPHSDSTMWPIGIVSRPFFLYLCQSFAVVRECVHCILRRILSMAIYIKYYQSSLASSLACLRLSLCLSSCAQFPHISNAQPQNIPSAAMANSKEAPATSTPVTLGRAFKNEGAPIQSKEEECN